MSFLSSIAHALGIDRLPGASQIINVIDQQLSHMLPPGIADLLRGLDGFGLLSSLAGGTGLEGIIGVMFPEAAAVLAGMELVSKLMGYAGQAFPTGHDPRYCPPDPAGPHGSESLNNQVNDILSDPGLSVEEKMMRLAALLADALDKKSEDLMRKWSDDVDNALKMSKDKKKNDPYAAERNSKYQQYQMQIQNIMSKKSQLLSIISNMLHSMHQVNMSIARNVA